MITTVAVRLLISAGLEETVGNEGAALSYGNTNTHTYIHTQIPMHHFVLVLAYTC